MVRSIASRTIAAFPPLPVITGRTVIEDHADVGTERGLDLEHAARSHACGRAVEVRAIVDTGVVDLLEAAQAEDLIAAGVGEDRTGPAHERVDAPNLAHALGPGAMREVVRVGEHDLRADLAQLVGEHALDRAVGADRHEARSLDGAVCGPQASGAGVGGGVFGEDLERTRCGVGWGSASRELGECRQPLGRIAAQMFGVAHRWPASYRTAPSRAIARARG